MKRFKKLLLAVCLCTTFAACNDEAHVFVAEDLLGLAIENGSGWVGSENPTTVSLTPGTAAFEYEICVTRNYFTGKEYPKMTAQVLADPTSTAVAGIDFTLPQTPIVFTSAKQTIQRFNIVIHKAKDTQPKTIVLRLDYGHEETCPLESRKADKLIIKLVPQQ